MKAKDVFLPQSPKRLPEVSRNIQHSWNGSRLRAHAPSLGACAVRWNRTFDYWCASWEDVAPPKQNHRLNNRFGWRWRNEEQKGMDQADENQKCQELHAFLVHLAKISSVWKKNQWKYGAEFIKRLHPDKDVTDAIKTTWNKHTVTGQETTREGQRREKGKQVFFPGLYDDYHTMLYKIDVLLRDAIVATLHHGTTILERVCFPGDANRAGGPHWIITARVKDGDVGHHYPGQATPYYRVIFKIKEEPTAQRIGKALFTGIYPYAPKFDQIGEAFFSEPQGRLKTHRELCTEGELMKPKFVSHTASQAAFNRFGRPRRTTSKGN